MKLMNQFIVEISKSFLRTIACDDVGLREYKIIQLSYPQPDIADIVINLCLFSNVNGTNYRNHIFGVKNKGSLVNSSYRKGIYCVWCQYSNNTEGKSFNNVQKKIKLLSEPRHWFSSNCVSMKRWNHFVQTCISN